ncbi:MAG: DUF349 domain-containing protein [Bacteroidales bacterium]|nr:DUF349 domain-containing protein [Bacteroidales bacterium]
MTEKEPTAENIQPDPIEKTEATVEPADETKQELPEITETSELPAEEPPQPIEPETAEQPVEEAPEAVAEEIPEPADEPVDGPIDEVKEDDAEKPCVDEEPSETDEPDEEESGDENLLKEISDSGKPDTAETVEDDEEEDEEPADEQEEILENYDSFDREKLVEVLEETVKDTNIQKVKTRVSMIKVAFLKLSKEYREAKLQEYLDGGGAKESYDPEPDVLMEKFNQVFEIYKKNKAKYNEHQEVVKLRNLEAKKEILEELRELINSEESLKKTYDKFKELQTKWKEIGLVPSTEINNLWQNYHFLVEKFFDKVKINKELRDLDLKKNLEKKVELCEKAEELLIEPSVVKSFQTLQKYHEEWKEIGPVPQDVRDEIWERFKTATDKINELRREHFSNLAADQENNLLLKTALCEKAEQLASMEFETLKEWQEKTREVNELFREWKLVGPAPKKENDEIWERFKTLLNTFFNNKKEFFSKLKQEQVNNFNLKLDIVKQAEALKDSTDWKKTTQELIGLQKEWRDIGPVPRKHSDKIWKRFRAACDEFFNSKNKFFSAAGESEKENLDKKLALIKKMEEWKGGKDKSANLDELKSFQREFMEIGHVPIREKNKVHDAFRQAINKHLDELNISSYEMRVSDYQPRQGQTRDYSGGDGRYQRRTDSGGGLSTKISKLREEIMLWENNIGFLAHTKKAELLRQEFEKKIQDAKEELAQLEAKLKSMQD